MHGSLAMIRALVSNLQQSLNKIDLAHAEIVLCPPVIYLNEVNNLVRGSKLKLGAQDVSYALSGAYTGQVSATMLLDYNCEYVLLGHSERRQHAAETDADVAKKLFTSLQVGLKPILCVGEGLQAQQQGKAEEVLVKQLAILQDINLVRELKGQPLFIAYEPVWAIGTGRAATFEHVAKMHDFIREHVAGIPVSILYGGSVKANNAKELLSLQQVDGLLVGGASLLAQEFLNICGVN